MPNGGLSRDPNGLEFVDTGPALRGVRIERSFARHHGKVIRSRLIASDSRQRQAQAEEIDRFREMHVEAGIAAALLVIRGKVGAHRNGGDVRILASYRRNKIVTVLVRQTDIAQDHVYLVLLEKIEAARGRVAGRNLVIPAPEDRREGALGV